MDRPLVSAAGWDYRHGPAFRIDRPRGLEDWVLILSTTPFLLGLPEGDRPLPTGTCLLWRPGQAQHYRAGGRVFANHWLHLDGGRAEVPGLVARIGLPCGEPMILGDPAPVAAALRRAWSELLGRAAGWQDAVAAAVTDTLVAIARQRTSDGHRHRVADARLRAVRARMLADPARAWTAAGMAALAGLSPARFRRRYRALFAVAPLADLVQARLERARQHLTGGASVAAAADLAGFRDLAYFHRQYRRHFAATPAMARGPGTGSELR